jgi:hypothetical protein
VMSDLFALAIAHANEALEPGSDAFGLRNPGLLREGTRLRRFKSLVDGLRALVADVEKLPPNMTVGLALQRYCGRANVEHEMVALDFLSQAKNEEVEKTTTMGEI